MGTTSASWPFTLTYVIYTPPPGRAVPAGSASTAASPVEGGSVNVLNDVAGPVEAPASVFNDADTAPGQANGAQGQSGSQATIQGNCLDAGP